MSRFAIVLRRARRSIVWTLAAAAALLGQASWALAQPKGAGVNIEEAKGQSYVLPYFLVALCIGLGLLSVARPSRRKTFEVKRDDDAAK